VRLSTGLALLTLGMWAFAAYDEIVDVVGHTAQLAEWLLGWLAPLSG
jgi:hypothetical protein